MFNVENVLQIHMKCCDKKKNTACEIYISHDQMHINIKCEHLLCQLHRKDGLEVYAGLSLWSCT